MIDRKFKGWSFRWAQIKQVPEWIRDGYPVFLPAAMIAVHLIVACLMGLGDELKLVDRWVAAALQIFGVFWIVKSIDSNLRLFELRPMRLRIKEYLSRCPLRRYDVSVALSPANLRISASAMSGRLTVDRSGLPLDERVAFLEGQMNALYERIDNEQQRTDGKLTDLKNTIDLKIAEVSERTKVLTESIKKQTDDGVGDQIMGVIWVCHAAVAGLYT